MIPATEHGPILAEQEMLHDGEPVFALSWGPGPLPNPFDENRRGSASLINRNIADPSAVTPEAAND